jgi:hypothetical protein
MIKLSGHLNRLDSFLPEAACWKAITVQNCKKEPFLDDIVERDGFKTGKSFVSWIQLFHCGSVFRVDADDSH